MTNIEWADRVWNPVTGCTKVSEGCRNCYAFETHGRRHKGFMNGAKLPKQYAEPFSKVQLFPERLQQPLKWKKPQRIFVNSMSDLFHEDIPFEFISEVFMTMALAQQHTFMVLTKRPKRMLEFFTEVNGLAPYHLAIGKAINWINKNEGCCFGDDVRLKWPLPNVWLGVSVENQKAADERIPLLLKTRSAVRFLSCEPLLGMVDLKLHDSLLYHTSGWWPPLSEYTKVGEGIDWVIVGGESGSKARPMHPDWVRSIRDQCAEFNIPFFFKQWGEWLPGSKIKPTEDVTYNVYQMQNGTYGRLVTPHRWDENTVSAKIGKKKAGRLLDGQEWSQFPDAEYQDCGECSCK